MSFDLMVSPHNDVKHFSKTAVAEVEHALLKGKQLPVPAFKDMPQMRAFNETLRAKLTLKARLANLVNSPHPRRTFEAIAHLEAQSRPQSARTSLTNARKTKVIGHALPGNMGKRLYSRASAGEIATPQEVAAMLVGMALQDGSVVQMKNCFSGAGANYVGDDWMERFHNGTLMEAFDPEESLAAAVEESLRNDHGKTVEVHGYLSAVTMHSQKVQLKNETRKAHHFGGVRIVFDGKGQAKPMDKVRLRDLKVRFPLSDEERLRIALAG